MIKTFDVDRDSALNYSEFQNLIRTLDSPLSSLTPAQVTFLYNAICQSQKLTNNVLTAWFSNMRNKSARKQMPYPEPFLPKVESSDFKEESIADDCVLLEHLQNYVKTHGIHHVERALKFYANLYNDDDQQCLSWNSLISVLRRDFRLCFDDYSINSFKAALFNHSLFTPVITEQKHLQSLYIPLKPFLHYISDDLPLQKQGGQLNAELSLVNQGKEAILLKIKRVMNSLEEGSATQENILRDALLSEFRSLNPTLLDELLDSIRKFWLKLAFSNPGLSSPWRMYYKPDIEAYLQDVLFNSPLRSFPFQSSIPQQNEKEIKYPQIYSQKSWQVQKKGSQLSVSELLMKLFRAVQKLIGKSKAIQCSIYLKERMKLKDQHKNGMIRLMDLIELFYELFSSDFQDIEFTSLFLYFRRMAGSRIGQVNFIAYPFLLHNLEQSFQLFASQEEKKL